MKLGIINSACEGTKLNTVRCIEIIKEIGFDTIDIQTDPLDIDIRTKKSILDTCKRVDLPIISLATTDLGLIDSHKSVREFSLKHCKAFLDLTYEFNANNFLLCMGQYLWDGNVMPKERPWQYGVEGLKQLGKYAQDLGVEIAIELVPFDNAMINSIDNMKKFLDDIGMSSVNANFDISHFYLEKIRPDEIRRIKDKIIHVHMSDCDGKVHGDLPPGRGVIDFKPYLQELKNFGYKGAISIELEYAPRQVEMIDWVKEAYTNTNSLMKEIGIRG